MGNRRLDRSVVIYALDEDRGVHKTVSSRCFMGMFRWADGSGQTTLHQECKFADPTVRVLDALGAGIKPYKRHACVIAAEGSFAFALGPSRRKVEGSSRNGSRASRAAGQIRWNAEVFLCEGDPSRVRVHRCECGDLAQVP